MIYDSILIGRCVVKVRTHHREKEEKEKKKTKTIEAILDFTTWQRPLGSLIFIHAGPPFRTGCTRKPCLLTRCFNDH